MCSFVVLWKSCCLLCYCFGETFNAKKLLCKWNISWLLYFWYNCIYCNIYFFIIIYKIIDRLVRLQPAHVWLLSSVSFILLLKKKFEFTLEFTLNLFLSSLTTFFSNFYFITLKNLEIVLNWFNSLFAFKFKFDYFFEWGLFCYIKNIVNCFKFILY